MNFVQIVTLALCLLPIAGIAEAVTPVKPAIAKCSPEDFKSFFEQFVHGSLETEKYISPEVEIRDYEYPSRLLMTISDKNYVIFKIGAIGNKYVMRSLIPFLGDAEQLKNRLKLDFQRVNAKMFRVNYIRAEFLNDKKDGDGTLVRTYGNPEAYVFEHRDGCWHLTQQLWQYKYWKASKTREPFTYTPRIFQVPNSTIYIASDGQTDYQNRIVTAYTDLFYYKKLDAQFGYAESDKRDRDRWREWKVIHEAVAKELTRFYSTLQCSNKVLAVVPRFDDYDDSSGTYGSQSLDRIATAIVDYQTSQAELRLSPEAAKNRWLEIRKQISINTQDACSILGN